MNSKGNTMATMDGKSLVQEPKCNPHPKAPHGFDRNASHSADRYVCECEGWDAYDAGYQAGIEDTYKRMDALDKMAENARELGLDYEPVAPVQEDWGPGPHECHSLTAAPVQEPVAWRYRGIFHEFDPSDWAEGPVTPLYTTPPAAQRQWQGLTDEDISAAYEQMTDYEMYDEFARAIEAKLKEKNSD
jgi:hypothetical protein